jgi:hypothetical protein
VQSAAPACSIFCLNPHTAMLAGHSTCNHSIRQQVHK